MKKEKKSFRIIWIDALLSAIIIVFAATSWITMNRAEVIYREAESVAEDYVNLQNGISEIQDMIAEITEQCRSYIITGKTQYLKEYKSLTGENDSDSYMEPIRKIDLSGDILEKIEQSLIYAEQLVEVEDYAVLLRAYANRMSDTEMQLYFSSTLLKDKDQNLTSAQLRTRAENMVFGEDYEKRISSIDNTLNKSLTQMLHTSRAQQLTRYQDVNVLLNRNHILITGIVVLIIMIFLITVASLILPIKRVINAIMTGNAMQERGSSESRALASAYNKMLEHTNRDKERFEYEASHDTLTGLWNKVKLSELLKTHRKDSALVLASVDEFGEINGRYGSAAGDLVLKNAANILSDVFGDTDIVCRVQGAQFAILVSGTDKYMAVWLMEKLDAVIRNMEEALITPKATFSIGAAFAEDEGVQSLYAMADEMRVKASEEGGARYRIFGIQY